MDEVFTGEIVGPEVKLYKDFIKVSMVMPDGMEPYDLPAALYVEYARIVRKLMVGYAKGLHTEMVLAKEELYQKITSYLQVIFATGEWECIEQYDRLGWGTLCTIEAVVESTVDRLASAIYQVYSKYGERFGPCVDFKYKADQIVWLFEVNKYQMKQLTYEGV